jgi:hypothetical protein
VVLLDFSFDHFYFFLGQKGPQTLHGVAFGEGSPIRLETNEFSMDFANN